jgi:hypothetical protein
MVNGASRVDPGFPGNLLDKIPAAHHLFIGAPSLAEIELALVIKLGRDAGGVVE